MQQIKIFKGIEHDLAGLEKEVNGWLAKTQVRVVSMVGNLAPQSPTAGQGQGGSLSPFPPSDVLLIVLYEPA